MLDSHTEPISIEVGLREATLTTPHQGLSKTMLLNPINGEPLVDAFVVSYRSYQEAMAEKLRAALTRRGETWPSATSSTWTTRFVNGHWTPGIVRFWTCCGASSGRLVPMRRSLSHEAVYRGQEAGEGLARAGGCGDEDVAARPDERPAPALRRRGFPEARAEPRRDTGVKEIDRHDHTTRPVLRARPPRIRRWGGGPG
jgi:hypothetical protein